MKRYQHRTLFCGILAGLAVFIFCNSLAFSHWSMPTDVPVVRLLMNVKEYVKEHPDNPQGWYILGRIHSLAFTMETRVIGVWEQRAPQSGLPEIAGDTFQWGDIWNEKSPDQVPSRAELIKHLEESIKATTKAIRLDPDPAGYHLGLAYVLEEGAVFAQRADILPQAIDGAPASEEKAKEIERWITELRSDHQPTRENAERELRDELQAAAPILHQHRDDENAHLRAAVDDLLTDFWRDIAASHYFEAFSRAAKDDLKIEFRPMRGLAVLLSYESGKGFVRLVKARGPRDDNEAKRLAQVEDGVQKLEDKPHSGIITPIVLSVDAAHSLGELLDPDLTVEFDLNGDGTVESWPWVKPDTGILVWDPHNRGRITSGRQLFGSVSWWMFFEDGYQALDALDDNRDGELAGSELRGIRIWFDRDRDGHSDPGEVVDLESVGVEAISVRALTMVGESPANPIGLRMRDGRLLPTYDWVTAPANEQRINAIGSE